MRVIMLSDERIAEIAEDIYCSEGTRAEIEHSIRAALTEAAQSVPVMGSPVAWTSPEWLKEKGKLHGSTRPHTSFKVPLYHAPATSITAQELDALRKDAERYRVLKSGDFSVEQFVSSSYGLKFVPMKELDAAIDAAMQEDKL